VLVFVDESGCTGFKFDKGSTKHFVVTMVFFETPESAEATAQKLSQIRTDRNYHDELHFKELPNNLRTTFYEYMDDCNFFYRSIIIDKTHIYSQHLKQNKKLFYNYVVGQMVRHDGGYLKDAKIIVDASCDRAFQTELNVYMRRKAREAGYFIHGIKFKDWRQNSLVQVADMMCGAIFRKHEKSDRQFYKQIMKKENDLWVFR
jgi:hypothetical protein